MKNLYLFISAVASLLMVNSAGAQSFPCSHATSQANSASRGVEETPTTAHTAREAQYDVKFYFLDLNLSKTVSDISGNVLIRANTVASVMDTFSVELASVFTVDSVLAKKNNGAFQTAPVLSHAGSDLNIDLPFTANTNDMVEARIYYHGTAGTSFGIPDGDGFFLGNGPSFSASPPYNSSTWWPCKQNLTDKADSSWFFITTDTSAQGISNGILSNVTDVSPTQKRWEWKSRYPINFYLISFVVGTYNNKSVQYFHPTNRTDSMRVEFYNISAGNTLDILQKFSDKFGLYPFYEEKFGLASVYLGGGMENQTIVSLGASGWVIEHETMHQWFGDNVSMGSYRDMALSEGFARWAEALYPELASNTPNATRISKLNPFESSALTYNSGSVYNYSNDTTSINGLYGGQAYAMYYNKAAMVINSLRFEVNNDSLFFLGLKNYQDAYKGKSVTGNNLRDIMETTVDMDLTDFFDQWYYGYGYPSFGIKWNHENGQKLIIQLSESTSSANTPLFKTSVEVTVKRLNASNIATDTTIRVFLAQEIDTFSIALGDSVTGFTVDPNQWIVNKTSFVAKDTSLHTPVVVNGIAEETNPVFRVYPNPASQYLMIQSNLPASEMMEVELYNAVGQKVQYAKMNSNQRMNVAALPNGIYMLHINHTTSQKLLVAH